MSCKVMEFSFVKRHRAEYHWLLIWIMRIDQIQQAIYSVRNVPTYIAAVIAHESVVS